MMNKKLKYIFLGCVLVLSIFISGCFVHGSGVEWGHVPSGTFAPPEGLPPFGSQLLDGWGILYTLEAGSFDPDHRSGTARQTYINYKKALDALENKRDGFSTGMENSTSKIEFTYPENWDEITEEQKKEMALQIGEYVGFNSMVWHEMLTWKGARLFMWLNDFQSAFSWEDIFCDLYGAKVAVEAIKMGGNFERNVTDLTREQLNDWQVVSMKMAKKITKNVKGTWWKREPFSFQTTILCRHMDIGCDDGMVTAAIIPGDHYTGEAASLEAPKLDLLDKYGLGIKYSITTLHYQGNELKKIAGVDRPIEPRKDFCKIIHALQKEAEEKYNYLVIK